MAEVFFDNPPVLNGKEAQQLQQLYAYLGIMSDKLNQALMSISIDQMAPAVQETIRTASAEQQDPSSSREALKSMIIKTAQIVRTEMTEIRTKLEASYQAISEEWGSYQAEYQRTIVDTATGVLNEFRVLENIQGLKDDSENFNSTFSSYIFMGEIDPINHTTGIAIGDSVTAYDPVTNQPYLNHERKTATFTVDRLSFWQGTTELAYFSNQVFHIANGEVTKSMKMGNHSWEIMPDGSMGLVAGGIPGGNA